ncbi:MAG: hypothetical protein AMQ22_01420 [Candidatus Methanofastidiosum methylothiophilum]|uniref:Uncharacterized protein n=1 Tax=Candidatus Methanofastidiosum methylothiophilum TaxID=1705564 RepID=A0A150J164_9EURY|nr:MAG: hypothetical protein AMQ22_01420 [Candidatus Methanofastidiosum methylthiophilus]
MKKIFSILVSLLFVVSFFGIVSVTATCNTPSIDRIEVGDTFTVYAPPLPCESNWNQYLALISVVGGDYTFKAIKPGKVTFCCGGCGCCTTGEDAVVVTIVPKEYPMASFMKILGFGNKD